MDRRRFWVRVAVAIALLVAFVGDLLARRVLDASGPVDLVLAAAIAVAYGLERRRWLGRLLWVVAAIAAAHLIARARAADVVFEAVLGGLAGAVGAWLVTYARTRARWRAFVVPHTHWDREWYETVAGYRPRLLAAIDGVVAELERPGGVDHFTLDGQTIALEDYLGDRPAMRERVDALVRAGRLLIGPWYVLSDLILVHAESTLRNLEEGLRVAAEHGRAMRVGYVADPFGHPAQMPQILRGFGYGSYVFARGLGDEGEDLGAEFEWQAPSGDRVLALHLVGHYENALYLVRDPERVDVVDANLVRRVRRELPRLLRVATAYAHSDVLLLMVGTDHAPATPELVPALAETRAARPRLETRLGTLEQAIDALPPLRLPVHAGEMIEGRYRPILRGVNSTRMWIKQENAACERLLLRWLEPFGALLGRVARADLRPLWRTLLANHPHDSICGCSIDEVHDVDMRARFESVRARGEALRADLLGSASGAAVAWSSLPFPASRVVEHAGAPRFVRFDGLGSARLDAAQPSRAVSSPSESVLENGVLRVEVAADGSFTLDGPGGRTGPHNVLVDEGDRGDLYTYSFAGPSASTAGARGERETRCDGLRGEVRVRLRLRVPVTLRPDRRARDERATELAIETVVRLDAEAEHVEIATTVDNRARDHRLRALFATGRGARTHLAGEQFAWVRRPNRRGTHAGWREQPPDTAHMQDFVAVVDSTGGVLVAGDGLPEYGVLAEGRHIALTLLRAVGYLSRGDLPERRGHAGPEIETPSAQLQGARVARYCVAPLASEEDLPRGARLAQLFREPPIVGTAEPRTLFALDTPDAVELSALRPGPRPGTLVLRLVNPVSTAGSARVRFASAIRPIRSTDLREGEDDLGSTGLAVVRAAAPLEPLADGSLEARLAPYEIATWLLEMTAAG